MKQEVTSRISADNNMYYVNYHYSDLNLSNNMTIQEVYKDINMKYNEINKKILRQKRIHIPKFYRGLYRYI